MVVVHIVLNRDAVLFKFKQDTSKRILDTFVTELRKLKHLPCVYNQNLVVGGPSITTPVSRSKGFNFCLVSYHKNKAALDEYQASDEHHHVTSKYMWPFNEDLTRFDFETDDDAFDFTTIPFIHSPALSHPSPSNSMSDEDPANKQKRGNPGQEQ